MLKGLDSLSRALLVSIFLFLACMFLAEWLFPDEGQIFQVVVSLISGFSGVFLSGVRKDKGLPDNTTDQRTTSETKPPAPPSA